MTLSQFIRDKHSTITFIEHRGSYFSLIPEDHVCINMMRNTFENLELDFVLSFLKPGDTFWDIGANFGLFSVLAAQKVGFFGSVVAFEPSPLNYQRLKTNLLANALFRVRVRRTALGKEARKEVLFHESTQGAYSGLKVGDIPGSITRILVPETTLDRLSPKFSRINLLKMDVEGGERDIIEGGKSFFQRKGRRPVVLAELDDERTLPAGYPAREIYTALSGFGYQWFSLEPDLKLKRQENRDTFQYVNLVACPEESLSVLDGYLVK